MLLAGGLKADFVFTLDLCRRLAQEVAGLLGYSCPALAEARVTDWIHSILSSREDERRGPCASRFTFYVVNLR